MPVHVQTYKDGLDRDTSQTKYSPSSYYLMKNLRLTDFDELSNGAVKSIKGNEILISSPPGLNIYYYIIGYCIIRDYLVVWATDCTTANPGGVDPNLAADPANDGSIFYCDLSAASPSWTLVYSSSSMNLTTQHPIDNEATGFYEDSETIKVYWTDNFNQPRFIDIISPGISDVSELDILTEIDFKIPVVQNIVSGNIYVGKVQYAYQQYNIGGVETKYSSATPLIHLTRSSEGFTGDTIRTYKGTKYLDDSGEPQSSGKGVIIKITDIDTSFDKVRVVALHYHALDAAPTIHVVGEYDTASDLIVSDYGTYSKGTITWNAFRTLGYPNLVVKSLEQRNNKLLLGNIKQRFYDVDFDARAYRFGPKPTLNTGQKLNVDYTSIGDIVIADSTNSKIRIEKTTPAAISSYLDYSLDDVAGGNPLDTHKYLRLKYVETGLSATSGSHVGGTILESANEMFQAVNDEEIDITINFFQTWAETNLGIPSERTITGVTALNQDTNNIQGEYTDIYANHNLVFNTDTSSITITHDSVADTLKIRFTKPAGIFSDVDYIELDPIAQATMTLGGAGFTLDYTYSEEHNYETTTESDLDHTLINPLVGNQPTVWFDIDKASGNWFTLSTVFDASKITEIEAWVEIEYTYTAMEPWCLVYNYKKPGGAGLQEVVKAGSWPNATFQIGGADVLEDNDCINPYNYDLVDNFLDEYATYWPVDDVTAHPDKAGYLKNCNSFKYFPDLATLGGEGPNVKYEFIETHMQADESADSRWTQADIVEVNDLTSYDSHQNPLKTAYLMSHKRDEVYRYGIKIKNTKGEVTPIHWIGDIKTPPVKDANLAAAAASRVGYLYALGIEFTVDCSNLPSDTYSFQIVRVKREEKDRTIYSQGAIGNLFDDGTWLAPLPRLAVRTPADNTVGLTRDANIIQFVSPEVNYFKDLSPGSNDYIKIQAVLKSRYTYMDFQTATPFPFDVAGVDETSQAGYSTDIAAENYFNVSKYLSASAAGLTTLPCHDVNDGMISGPVVYGAEDENAINLLGAPNSIMNRAQDYITGPTKFHEGPGGTCLMAILDSDISTTPLTGADEYEIYLVDYKRPGIATSQYGGLTHEARQQNEYIEAGGEVLITGSSHSTNCYRGDTFVNYFEHLRTIFETADEDGDGDWDDVDVATESRVGAVIIFPVESHINTALDHGFQFSKNYNLKNIYGLREKAGTYDAHKGAYGSLWPYDEYALHQEEDMYLYNSVYSQQNTSKVHFQKPEGWENELHHDTLVKMSLEKSIGEQTDSFLQFLSDNEKMLPTNFGALTDLFLFKNYIIVWFEKAFGTISIDDRALLPIQNNTLLEMGAADNLKFFDLISTKSGCSHPQSISQLGEGFCWFDINNAAFGFYNGNTQDIGLAKGMSSELKTMANTMSSYSNIWMGGDIMCVENNRYKEVLLAFSRTDMLTYTSHNATDVYFTGAYKPSAQENVVVYIDGVKYIADISATHINLNTTDNPTLSPSSFSRADPFFCYYRDLSLTLSFSSIINAFMFEVNIHPSYLIKHDDNLFEIFNRLNLYKENEGNYGEFYGNYEDGELIYLINPKQSLICVFNNYEYFMQAIASAGTNTINETWDTLQLTNDYQDSGLTSLVVDSNVKRRHRTWRIADLRDSAAIVPKARMRDAYIKAHFVYNHGSNKHIIMHDLYCYYYVTRESLIIR